MRAGTVLACTNSGMGWRNEGTSHPTQAIVIKRDYRLTPIGMGVDCGGRTGLRVVVATGKNFGPVQKRGVVDDARDKSPELLRPAGARSKRKSLRLEPRASQCCEEVKHVY